MRSPGSLRKRILRAVENLSQRCNRCTPHSTYHISTTPRTARHVRGRFVWESLRLRLASNSQHGNASANRPRGMDGSIPLHARFPRLLPPRQRMPEQIFINANGPEHVRAHLLFSMAMVVLSFTRTPFAKTLAHRYSCNSYVGCSIASS